jgi:hypothetical protein
MGSNRNLIIGAAALVLVIIIVFSVFSGGGEIEMPADGETTEEGG